MLLRSMAAAAIATAMAAAAYASSHMDTHPARLEAALKRFESDAARATGRGASLPGGDSFIIIVGGKTGMSAPSPFGAVGPPCRPRPRLSPPPDDEMTRQPPPDDSKARRSSLRGPSLGDKGIIIVNSRPASLNALSAEIRRFENSLVPPNPCVTACRASAQRCMTSCRSTLRAQRLQGQCSCEAVQARCLIRSARQGKCGRSGPSGGLHRH